MKRHWRLVAAYVLLLAASIGAAVLATNQSAHNQRVTLERAQTALRESQVAGCYRGRADRLDAIRGWSAAQKARLATAKNPKVGIRERLDAAAAAATYADVINGYQSRLVDCATAFPPVRINP